MRKSPKQTHRCFRRYGLGDCLLDGALGHTRLRNQVGDGLGINRRLENAAALDQFRVQFISVRQVAVVRNRDGALDIPHYQRLGIFAHAGACCGIADMGTGHLAGQLIQDFLIESLADQAHAFGIRHNAAVVHHNAAAFLTSMLLGKQSIVRSIGHIDGAIRAADAKYTAFLMRFRVIFKCADQKTSPSLFG